MKGIKFLAWMLVYLAIILLAMWGGYYFVSTPGADYRIALACIVPLAFLPIVNKLVNKARYDAKSNDMGMMNDFEYVNLSKEEQREFDKLRQMEMERLLPQSALKKMTHQGPKNPKEEIEKMTGLAPVKKQLKEILARAEYDKANDKKAKFDSHFVFYGAPGTGKTTVARIMTSYLYNTKCIRENKCIECDGNTLKGSAPGEGAQKAEILVRRAMGGILFIDEAYAMMDNMGCEAVNTLIKLMEDQRGNFVLILAGYTEEIKMLLNQNPGFRSRIKDYIKFPDYSTEEAKDIFRNMAGEKNLVVTAAAMDRFAEKYEQAKQARDFGNARTVRNILDRAITCHAVNISDKKLSAEEKYQITGMDME